MLEDDLWAILDRVLQSAGASIEAGEEFREPPLDISRYYHRPVRLHALPILGRALSVVCVARQPIDVALSNGYPTLLKRLALAVNGRFPPFKRRSGLSIGLTALITTPEPIGPDDDRLLKEALAARFRARVVPLGIVRVNLGQEAMSFALSGGPAALFPEPGAVVDALTPRFRRFVPLVQL
jgi:hypothetical protein